ncbi:MAG TPA: PQQ-binding-like beta-propeller repeat protein [Acidimicrobiales bacterium]|nr:PQQ-binding-like beta-propeller repeat protein [Acidimicrobiales bacterium]
MFSLFAASAGLTIGPVRPAAATSGGAWLTYHFDNQRSGIDPAGTNLTGAQPAWTSPTLDGQVYAEPLVDGSLVIVATEGDTVYGLSAGSGAVVWSTHLGSPVPQSDLPCGDINPLGITGTPVIDPSTGRLYLVAEELVGGKVVHQLAALDANSGKVIFTESADPAGMNATDQQQRAALTLSGGNVYVEYGGLYGDCGSYHGWVVSAPASGPGTLTVYQVPTQNEGAVWAPPGAVLDSSGNLFVATGNGASTSTYDYGNSVIKLSPGLKQLDSFAPSNWASDNSSDADLGSTSPALLSDGLVFQVGKERTGYLLSSTHLGGIGGQLYSANVCFATGGDAESGNDVYVSCSTGVEDVHVTASPPSFKVAWTGPSGATGPPVLAGGMVWSSGGSTLYGLNPTSGAVVQSLSIGSNPVHFATPSVGDGLLLLGVSNTVRAFAASGGAAPPPAPVTNAGYWMTASGGAVYNFGDVASYGSEAGKVGPGGPVVGMAPTADAKGYWLAGASGAVYNFGDAGAYGSAAGRPLARPVVGMVATPDGHGYWLVASDGGVFSYGDAGFFGSTGAMRLNQPIVGLASTLDGRGYWLVASDGGIFSFGDAVFHGSTGAMHLNQPVVGMAATGDGGGYWLVASDGGIFCFGDAGFHGSAGAAHLARPVVGMAADTATGGYWLVASDGGVFSYDAPFAGSEGAQSLPAPVVGMAGHSS